MSGNFRRPFHVLACTSALASAWLLAMPTMAHAEEAAAEDSNEIIVTGSITEAQMASIELKRDAPNLIDIAAADAVGRFADQNSAAGLLV